MAGAGKKGRRIPGVRSIRSQVTGMLLACYLIPAVLLGAFARLVLVRGLEKRTRDAITSEADHAWSQTEQQMDRLVDLSRDATYDGELTGIWTRWNGKEIGDSELLRLSRSYLDRKYSRERLFLSAAFFPTDRPELLATAYFRNAESPATMQALRETVMKIGEELDTSCRFISVRDRLYLIRNLLNQRMRRFGMLILEVNREEAFAPLIRLEERYGGRVSLRLDDYSEKETGWESLPAGLEDDPGRQELRYGRRNTGADYDFRILLRLDRREQYRDSYRFRLLTGLVLVLLIPILLIILRYVRKRLVHPINRLLDASRRIEAGEFGVTVPMHGEDELGQLGSAFSSMSLRLKELIDKTYKEEIELRNARIQALQSRINPHFVNNALEEINWQARIDGSETVSAMVGSLSVLLNASMDRENRSRVSLREEMEVAEAYIYFVQQRFGEDLQVTREIQPETLECEVPLLTVQPVLENAVEHGIAQAGGGRITLRSGLEQGKLRLEIENTGRPMDGTDRERIAAALRGEDAGSHLGLANITRRLRLIYGEAAEVEAASGKAGETLIRITLPARRSDGTPEEKKLAAGERKRGDET